MTDNGGLKPVTKFHSTNQLSFHRGICNKFDICLANAIFVFATKFIRTTCIQVEERESYPKMILCFIFTGQVIIQKNILRKSNFCTMDTKPIIKLNIMGDYRSN
jgi:hypothetical protein